MSSPLKHSRPAVFISYSRLDFNFAEAATATLNLDDRVEAWMDVQHLRPGLDWGVTIDESLHTADVLLLIASPTALASSYVTDEWHQALARGIPIHIAVVEAVELPPELADCPVHDLRTRFWQQAIEIGRLIAGNQHVSTAVLPRPNKLGLPARTPFQLTVLLSVALFISIGLLYIAIVAWELYTAFILDDPPVFITRRERLSGALALFYASSLAGTAVTMLVVATGVLRRRSTASMLGYTFGLAAIFALYSVLSIIDLMDMAAHTTSHYELDNAPGNLLILAGFLLVAIAVGGALLTRSRTVHLWLPTGESFYRVRQRILGLPIGRRRKIHMFRPNLSYQWESYGRRVIKLLAGRKRMTFDVRCDLTDLPVAEVIKKACLSAGLFEDKRGGQWVFVLVSSMTDWEKARTDHKKLGQRAIFVLVDSVQLPPDANELRRHQWLDFREQLPEGLFNLLVALCTDKAEDHDSASLPINTHRFRAPQFVRGLVELSRTYIVSIAAFALGAVVLRPLEISTSTLLGISVLLIVCLARLMILTATRQLTKEQFGSLAGITCLLMLLWLIVVISIVPGEPAIMGLLWPIVLLVSLVGTLIRIYLHVSRYWLPKSIGLTSQRSVVAVDPPLFTSSMPLIASMSFGMAIIFFQ